METYLTVILNQPLSKLYNTYYECKDDLKREIILSSSNELLLLHGIILLLPQELLLHIVSFLFHDTQCINLYYTEYSLHNAFMMYQTVLLHRTECLFMYPEETKMIINTKNSTYITFEDYVAIDHVDDEMKDIISELYVLPPITYIKHNVKWLLLVNMVIFIIILCVVGAVAIMYWYGMSLKALIIIIPPMALFFLFICCLTSYGMFSDIKKRSTQIKNYHLVN
jgi:hypothetical protein